MAKPTIRRFRNVPYRQGRESRPRIAMRAGCSAGHFKPAGRGQSLASCLAQAEHGVHAREHSGGNGPTCIIRTRARPHCQWHLPASQGQTRSCQCSGPGSESVRVGVPGPRGRGGSGIGASLSRPASRSRCPARRSLALARAGCQRASAASEAASVTVTRSLSASLSASGGPGPFLS